MWLNLQPCSCHCSVTETLNETTDYLVFCLQGMADALRVWQSQRKSNQICKFAQATQAPRCIWTLVLDHERNTAHSSIQHKHTTFTKDTLSHLGRLSNQFLHIRMPVSVMILSGWNCTPSMCWYSLCLTPMMVPSSIQAVISRQFGQLSFSITRL
jgi:hypothetical protein